ncbi:MAG: hypothetical protein A3K03_12005, partial [Bdellovibrionales bacterium RIFOXYD1_FULL_44_7]
MNKCDISILIATRNRPKMLAACIRSLLTQKSEISYEIVVLDQSDAKKKRSFLPNEDGVRIVRCDFRNKSRALNLGVHLCLSDYIAVLDDDCIAQEQWIESMYYALLSEPHTVVTGRVIAGDREEGAVRSRLHDDITERLVYQKKEITPIFKLSGCNFGFSKAVFKVVGPFNEDFGPGSLFRSSDDNEWSYRVLQCGLKISYDPRVVIFHRSWRDKVTDTELMRDYGYAAGAFFGFISNFSKRDFFYHSVRLWRWILGAVLFSFNRREIGNHLGYGVHFVQGFRAYHYYVK